MTRIGFAYNQKPEPEAADAAAELSRADEEPPSSGTRNDSAVATLLAPAPDDEYAEWDSAETIDAVARALARHGIRTVRDGLRWPFIETSPGRYDWSSWLGQLRAARETGTRKATLGVPTLGVHAPDKAAAHATSGDGGTTPVRGA